MCPAFVLLLLASQHPAHAGTWSILYNVTATEQVDGGSVQSVTWPRVPGGFTPVSALPTYLKASITATLQATATLTWNPSGAGDNPPTSVTLLENVTGQGGLSQQYLALDAQSSPHSWTNPLVVSSVTYNLTDDFGDAYTAVDPYSGSVGANHLYTIQNPTRATVLTLPTRHFTTTGSFTNSQPTWTFPNENNIYYTASIVNATLQASSVGQNLSASPAFLSGTYCKAQEYAVPLSGYIKQAQLLITDTNNSDVVIKQYYDTSAAPSPLPGNAVTGTNQTSATLTCFFDSTHFSDNTSVTMKMKAWDTAGGYYDGLITGPVYNKGYVAGEAATTHYGAKAESFVYAQMLSADINPTGTTTDNRAVEVAGIPTYCSFFTYAHGQGTPGDLYFEPAGGIGNDFGRIYATYAIDYANTAQAPRNDITEAVALKSATQPRYNLVFLDVCNSAAGYTLNNAFGINAESSLNPDSAFLGWTTLVEDSLNNADWADYVCQQLQGGRTIQQSIDDANYYYRATPLHESTDPLSDLAEYQINGDTGMTLHATVYRGLQNQWFR